MWTFLISPKEIVGAIHYLNTALLHHARREEIELLVGTCACESDMGKYRRQIGGGPASGIMQIETLTARDIWGRYLPERRPSLYTDFQAMCFGITDASEFFYPEDDDLLRSILTVRDDVSILLARAKYLTDPRPIPTRRDDQAAYYKRVYNAGGAGTRGKFLKAYLDHGCEALVDSCYPKG